MKARARWAGCSAVALAAVVASAGCGSSSSGPSGEGDGGPQYYTSPEASPDGEGGAADSGPEAPACAIPAAATIMQMEPGGNTGSCAPQVANGQCDSSSYRLVCVASDPNYLPVPDTSLGCQLEAPSMPTRFTYCCMCGG